jgi:type I restriction enzyme R subunit
VSRLSEKRDVQEALVHFLIGSGWEYLPPDDVLQVRGRNLREPFLPTIARDSLIALNPGLVTSENVGDVLHRLRTVRADMRGNEDFLAALRGRWTVYDEAEKRERNLTLVAFDDLGANRFTFTQEFKFEDRDVRRADMMLFVNGFPVVIVENKSPTGKEPELEAFDQVQRVYTERIPELLKFPQLFAACDARLHYGATWNRDLKAFYRWKAEGKDYGLERLSKSLFARDHLLKILRDYVIFYRADDQTHKFVLRPHQMRAVERVVHRVVAALSPSPLPTLGEGPGVRAKSGLVWHTQGSGKSLSMIVAAAKLRRLEQLANPTLLIVVDRLELESQMVQNLEAFGFPAVTRAESKDHLRELLAADYRGLIVTLIHKFDRMPKDLSRRENIVALIDEAHRSQEGDLATYMRAALPNGVYFGFTGTPVDRGKVGRGTFETFGKPDPSGYLDKYGIDESVEDGTTVRLYYTLTPLELRLDRDTLEREFFRVVEDAGVASIEELNRLLDKAEKLKAVLKAPERVDRIARHIAQHYRENVEPRGFKGFVVAIDREGCALYKQALDRYLPEEYTQVVYTAGHKDSDLLREHHIDDEEEKRIRRAFRDPNRQPRLLIVTQKLLTGFDAPILYAMYLDKPLKDHTLLQAIARVNRPYPAKESGLVVDYIGIFEDLQRALAFEDETITKGLINLEELRRRFADLLTAAQAALALVDLSDTPGRPARIIDHFFEEDRREAFVRLFKELQTAYEILSPDPFLRDYLDDYALIVQVYQVVYNYFNPEAERRRVQRDLLQKTDALIREHVSVEGLTDLPLYPVHRDIANVVKADDVSDRVKVTNLYRSLVLYIEDHQHEQPYLIPIGEQVEDVIQRLREKQISVQTALEQVTALTENAVAAQEEQARSDLSGDEFALYWVLKGQDFPDPKIIAREVHQILADHPGWAYNRNQESAARLQLYKILTSRMQKRPRRDIVGEEPAPMLVQARRAAALKTTVDALLRMSKVVAT